MARTQTWTEEVSLLGFVAANQRTIGDAIDVLHRYGTTFSDGYSWQVIDDGVHVILRTAPTGPLDRIGWQAYQEFQAIDVVTISINVLAIAGCGVEREVQTSEVQSLLCPEEGVANVTCEGSGYGVDENGNEVACFDCGFVWGATCCYPYILDLVAEPQ